MCVYKLFKNFYKKKKANALKKIILTQKKSFHILRDYMAKILELRYNFVSAYLKGNLTNSELKFSSF